MVVSYFLPSRLHLFANVYIYPLFLLRWYLVLWIAISLKSLFKKGKVVYTFLFWAFYISPLEREEKHCASTCRCESMFLWWLKRRCCVCSVFITKRAWQSMVHQTNVLFLHMLL